MMTPAWVQTLFQALDSFDADTFAKFLTEDAIFVFGNADPLKGKHTIRDGVASFSLASQQFATMLSKPGRCLRRLSAAGL